MKEPWEILERVQGLLCAELDRRLEEGSKRLPHLCTHNHRQRLDERPMVEGQPNPNYNRIALPMVPTIGLCMIGAESPEEWGGTICEEPIDAQRCPVFASLRSKEVILRQFREQVQDHEWLAVNMPGVSELIWAAGVKQVPEVPFWKRVLLWFFRIKIEPVQTFVDLTPLLPGPSNEALRS